MLLSNTSLTLIVYCRRGSSDIEANPDWWIRSVLDQLFTVCLFMSSVFNSLDMSRSVSVTAAGQCRLAPLIQVILDSSHLYDYTVKLLFKLHSCESHTDTSHTDGSEIYVDDKQTCCFVRL